MVAEVLPLVSNYLFCAEIDFGGYAKLGHNLLDQYINIHEVAVLCMAQWQCEGKDTLKNNTKKD